MRTITQREFRKQAAAVMDAVETGETFHITRNEVEVAEVRPLPRRRRLTARELVERHRNLPRIDADRMRAEATSTSGPRTGSTRATMSEHHVSGVLDTCTFIDLPVLDPAVLPDYPEITSVTMAELHQGAAMAQDPVSRAARTERLRIAAMDSVALPFDGEAAPVTEPSWH